MTDISQLTITFSDGESVPASKMITLVAKVNELVNQANNQTNLLDTISKSELLVVAEKASIQNIPGDGQNNVISGWTTILNKNSIFNAATGVATIPSQGTYTVIAKTLFSINNVMQPRSKIWISVNGVEVGLSEDTVFSEQNLMIGNYRRNHEVNATSQMSPGFPLLLNAQIWGSQNAQIFADNNTVFKLYREIV